MLLKVRRDLMGYFNSRVRKRPFFAVFRITRRCDLRCRMCQVWHHGSIKEELPLADVQRIAENLKKLGVPYVIITGGEPFLHSQLFEIIEIFAKNGFAIRLETNASKAVTAEKLDRAVASGAIDFSVSLDTLDPEKQDYICDRHKVWGEITENIDHALAVFPGDLPLINTVISRVNYQDIVQLVKYVDEKGAYIMLVPVVLNNVGPEDEAMFRGTCAEFVFREEDFDKVEELYTELIGMRKKGYNILNSTRFLKDSSAAITTGNLRWECDAGEFYIEIQPNGQMGLCNDIPDRLSLLDDDFIPRYLSAEYRNRARKRRKQCSGCTYGIYREVTYHMYDYLVLGERIIDLTKELKRRILGKHSIPSKSSWRLYK